MRFLYFYLPSPSWAHRTAGSTSGNGPGGIHRCLGSHLARIELRVALTEWHRRIPAYSVAPGAELTFTAGIRTLDRFPMVLGPGPA